jgi:hypothetical protein
MTDLAERWRVVGSLTSWNQERRHVVCENDSTVTSVAAAWHGRHKKIGDPAAMRVP